MLKDYSLQDRLNDILLFGLFELIFHFSQGRVNVFINSKENDFSSSVLCMRSGSGFRVEGGEQDRQDPSCPGEQEERDRNEISREINKDVLKSAVCY